MHQDVKTDSDFMRMDFDVTERRKTDEEIVSLVRDLFVEVRQMRKELKDHISDEAIVLKHAFPQEDPDGHRRAHEAWILKAEKQAKFWELLYNTLRIGGIVSVIGFLLAAGWVAFLKGPKL